MRIKKNIFSLELLFKMTHELHLNGKRIALTHGVFDLFHYSHLDLINQSAAICDYLIVGIESDQNVRIYKSSERPIIDQDSRMKLVSQLDCVDAVFVNEYIPNPELYIDLYKELHLDFVTIGDRFHDEEIAEYQANKSGIDLIHLHPDDRYTTTNIIQKIIKERPVEKKVPRCNY